MAYICIIDQAAGLKCYVCKSEEHSSCAEKDKLGDFEQKCEEDSSDHKEYFCYKVVFEGSTIIETERLCFTKLMMGDDFCDYKKKYSDRKDHKLKYCGKCKDDLCNSSRSLSPIFLKLLIALTVVLFL